MNYAEITQQPEVPIPRKSELKACIELIGYWIVDSIKLGKRMQFRRLLVQSNLIGLLMNHDFNCRCAIRGLTVERTGGTIIKEINAVGPRASTESRENFRRPALRHRK